MNVQIKQSQGGYHVIDVQDYDVYCHFHNTTSFSSFILRQLEVEDIYGFFFKGKKELTVLDLGANVGLFSIHVADACKKVYAVEPTPSHFQILQKNIRGLPQIEPLNHAVSVEDKQIDFFLHEDNSTMNSLVQRTNGERKISVNGLTLKSLMASIGNPTIDFCKVDIEGSELFSITEAQVAATKHLIKGFFMEVHEVEGKSFYEMIYHFSVMFEQQGYKVLVLSRDSFWAYQE